MLPPVRRRARLLAAALAACSLLALAASAQNNVLILLADDLGVDNVTVYGEGGNPPPTPNIDALAQSGVLFRNFWSNPICSPTRACIMTGRYSTRTGVGTVIPGTELGLIETTIPEQLDARQSGYAHGAFGKWHVSNPGSGETAPNDHGWSHFAGFVVGMSDYFNWPRTVNGVTMTSTNYVASQVVDDALAWIQNQNGPWVCYIGLPSPHEPFHAPPANLHTQNLAGLDPTVTPRPFYRAMVEAMDTEIGRLLAGLGPQLAQTNVIFTGDNGTPGAVVEAPFVPSQGKGTPSEGGINVPMIISGPAVVTPGRETAALAGVVDIFSTALELAGVVPNPLFVRLDGVSMVPYLANPAQAPLRQYVYAELFTPTFGVDFTTVRNAQYKLIRGRTPQGQIEALYDLINDPFEGINLNVGVLTPVLQTNIDALRQEIANIRTATPGFQAIGAPGCLGSTGQPVTAGTGTPRFNSVYTVHLTNAAPSMPVQLFVGGSDKYYGALPLPFPLTFLGSGPHCQWLVSADLTVGLATDPQGAASLAIPLPVMPWVLGGAIFHQWLIVDPAANPFGVIFSRGLKVTVAG